MSKYKSDNPNQNKHYLLSKVKSTASAYFLWFLLGAHYIYFGKWGIQFLYWITLGGAGIWALIDFFTMPGKVERHNASIFLQIEEIEKKERDVERAKNIAFITPARRSKTGILY